MSNHIDRRSFLRRATGAGVLIAVSQLPAMAEDKPEVFPKRGGFERLSLAYATVEIGLEKPFSVLHISDTHFRQPIHTRARRSRSCAKCARSASADARRRLCATRWRGHATM